MINRIRVSIKKNLAGIALLSAELITVLVLFICALLGFVFIAFRIFNLQNDHFDFTVFEKLEGIVSEPLTRFMQTITFLGNHQFLVPANLVLIAYFLFVKRRR
ncbi:MAG: hypothetical protein EOO01_28020, partial [Chitinophagaceae bacterium]